MLAGRQLGALLPELRPTPLDATARLGLASAFRSAADAAFSLNLMFLPQVVPSPSIFSAPRANGDVGLCLPAPRECPLAAHRPGAKTPKIENPAGRDLLGLGTRRARAAPASPLRRASDAPIPRPGRRGDRRAHWGALGPAPGAARGGTGPHRLSVGVCGATRKVRVRVLG